MAKFTFLILDIMTMLKVRNLFLENGGFSCIYSKESSPNFSSNAKRI